jgi:PAS domain S-box-containing protein
VDDDPDFSSLAAEFLQRSDDRINIDSVTNPSEGIERLSSTGYDCVISDYDMPGENGIEFLKLVREGYPDLPFILFTGKGSEEIASEAISAGVTDYLQKESGTDQYAVLANRARNAVEKYRAEKEVKQTQTRLHAITQNSKDTILTIDAEGQIVFANNAAEDLLGYPPADLQGTPLISLLSTSDRDQHATNFERYLKTAEHPLDWQTIEFDMLHREGNEISVWISFGEFEEDGEQLFVGILRDVTERQQLQAELEQSLTLHQTLLEQDLAGIYLLQGDQFEYVNSKFCDITGYDETDFESMAVLDIVAEESKEEVSENIQKRLAGEIDELEYNLTIRRKDGELRLVRAHGTRIELDDGPAILGSIVDLTDQFELQEEVEHEHGLLERVLETSPVGITIITPDGQIERANSHAQRVLGLTEAEILDRSYDDPDWNITDADGNQIPANDLPFARVVETGEPVFGYEHAISEPDGVERWLSVNAVPLLTESAEIERVIAVTIDISERRENELRLQEQNDRLEEFASMASHDLRNPLSVARGSLEQAREESDSDLLDEVAEAHDRMAVLIDDLLRMAREGQADAEHVRVELADAAEASWVNVDTDQATLVTETNAVIQADEVRVLQLFENLFRNAIEHGNGDVTVTVGDLPDGFYIEDDGPGIPEDRRGEIFEAGSSTRIEGTGYGLTIVKRVADAHGWSVAVTDGSTGGARFEFTAVGSG